MSNKSRVFLGTAGFALLTSLIFRFAFAPPAIGVSDFAVGLGVALMFGALLNWQRRNAPKA